MEPRAQVWTDVVPLKAVKATLLVYMDAWVVQSRTKLVKMTGLEYPICQLNSRG